MNFLHLTLDLFLKRLRNYHNGHIGFNSYNNLTKFFNLRQAEKGWIFQDILLVANIIVKIVLKMLFFTFSNANI